MGAGVLYQVSLIAAFVAGVVALFAPCCISYLLPAYFANVFRERRRVLFMTLIYSAGIFVVMLPVVLGARFLSELFFKLHDQTYIAGGGVMIAVGALAFLGIKLPLPHFKKHRPPSGRGQTDIISTFTLGLFSGVTSACCAPVLLGVLTLSALSPSLLLSLGVGMAYVLGMVAPLYLASLWLKRGNILERPWFRKRLGAVRLGDKTYPVYGSNAAAAAVFIGTGVLMLALTFSGRLGMDSEQSEVAAAARAAAEKVTQLTASVPLVNVIFGLLLLGGLGWFIRRSLSERGSEVDNKEEELEEEKELDGGREE